MIQITAQMRVLVAIESVDGRKGIDSLVRLCQEKLSEDPFSGCVFVFRSRSGTAIRLDSYGGQKRPNRLCRPSRWKPMKLSC
jgi:transposase